MLKPLWNLAQQWKWRPELPVLVAVLAVVGIGWAFVKIADEVTEGETQKFDQRIVDALRDPENPRLPIGPRWLREGLRDITAIGGTVVLTMMTIFVSGYLLLRDKKHAMWLMILAVVSGAIVSTSLKHFFQRDRPPIGSDLAYTITSSFPSGHSMLSAVVYLVLGTLLARTEPRRGIRIYFMVMAVLLTLLVGLSRIYLGVHYPTDVLAGWTAGLGWAMIWWLIARYLQHRGKVEPAGSTQAVEAPDVGAKVVARQ